MNKTHKQAHTLDKYLKKLNELVIPIQKKNMKKKLFFILTD